MFRYAGPLSPRAGFALDIWIFRHRRRPPTVAIISGPHIGRQRPEYKIPPVKKHRPDGKTPLVALYVLKRIPPNRVAFLPGSVTAPTVANFGGSK